MLQLKEEIKKQKREVQALCRSNTKQSHKKTMSLDQFNMLPAASTQGNELRKESDSDTDDIYNTTATLAVQKPTYTLPSRKDEDYFNKIDSDVDKILNHENIQEKYSKVR